MCECKTHRSPMPVLFLIYTKTSFLVFFYKDSWYVQIGISAHVVVSLYCCLKHVLCIHTDKTFIHR